MNIEKVIVEIKTDLGFRNSPSCELLFHKIDYNTVITTKHQAEAARVRDEVIGYLRAYGYDYEWVKTVLTNDYLLEFETEIGDVIDAIYNNITVTD